MNKFLREIVIKRNIKWVNDCLTTLKRIEDDLAITFYLPEKETKIYLKAGELSLNGLKEQLEKELCKKID